MLVPIACAKCGKPCQVAESAIGQMATCPWCKDNVPALPVGQVASEPLPLDEPDDSPTPPPSAPRTSIEPTPALPEEPALRSSGRRVVRLVGLLVLMPVVFGLAFAATRYGSGWAPDIGWVTFVAPDGSCRAEMPTAV